MRLLPGTLALLSAAACSAPAPGHPPGGPAAPAGAGSASPPDLRSAAPEEAPPTAEEITRRCLDYGYERDEPERADCVRLQERDFLLRPKPFVWPGQAPGAEAPEASESRRPRIRRAGGSGGPRERRPSRVARVAAAGQGRDRGREPAPAERHGPAPHRHLERA